MQTKLLLLSIMLCVCAACAPENKCSGAYVYDEAMELCTPCPKGATFKDGTCVCPTGMDYKNFVCVKGTGGAAGMTSDMEDAGTTPDSGSMMMAGGATCTDYCSFANTCIGMNGLAAALGGLSADLHADDPAACKTSCQSDLGSKEAGNAALACMKTMGAAAMPMCSDPSPDGLTASFGVLRECCGTRGSDPLCKHICMTLKGNPVVSSKIDFCP